MFEIVFVHFHHRYVHRCFFFCASVLRALPAIDEIVQNQRDEDIENNDGRREPPQNKIDLKNEFLRDFG